MVLSFIGISCKSNSWDESHPLLSCVPLPMTAHAALIRVSNGSIALHELLNVLLTQSEIPLGSSVECTLRKEKVELCIVCALLSKVLKAVAETYLGIQPDGTNRLRLLCTCGNIFSPYWHSAMSLHPCNKDLSGCCLSIGRSVMAAKFYVRLKANSSAATFASMQVSG